MGNLTYIILIAVLCLCLAKNANQFGDKFSLYKCCKRQAKSSLNIGAVLVFSLIHFHGSKFRAAFHWGKKEGKRGKKKGKKRMKPQKKK